MKGPILDGINDPDDGDDHPDDGEKDEKGNADEYQGEERGDTDQCPHDEVEEQSLNRKAANGAVFHQ